jgi:hypothetical protein
MLGQKVKDEKRDLEEKISLQEDLKLQDNQDNQEDLKLQDQKVDVLGEVQYQEDHVQAHQHQNG